MLKSDSGVTLAWWSPDPRAILPLDRFRPSTYVGIAPYVERKKEALACYAGELRPWPHPRSLEAVSALAQVRGSECGLEAAEALILLREVRR